MTFRRNLYYPLCNPDNQWSYSAGLQLFLEFYHLGKPDAKNIIACIQFLLGKRVYFTALQTQLLQTFNCTNATNILLIYLRGANECLFWNKRVGLYPWLSTTRPISALGVTCNNWKWYRYRTSSVLSKKAITLQVFSGIFILL